MFSYEVEERLNDAKPESPREGQEDKLKTQGTRASLPKKESVRYTEDEWLEYYSKTRKMQEQAKNWAVLFLTLGCIALCFVFLFICRPCLIIILIFSAIMCPFMHPMNAPLWLALVLLVFTGWNFTTGAFSFSWSGQRF